MQIKLPNSFIINGQPTQGKSYLIRSLLYQLRKEFDHGVVFSNTANVKGNYDYIPERRRYTTYDDDIIEQIIESQIELIKANKPCRMFIIFDDMLEANFNSKTMTKLYTQYRHYNITLFTSSQYYNKLPTHVRDNGAIIFLFRTDNLKTLKKFHEEYMGEMTFNEARRYIMDRTKAKYTHLMVIKNVPDEQKYTSGKAKQVSNFKFVF